LTTPTSPVATPIIIVCLWTWCNNYKIATMLIAVYTCLLSLFSVYLWFVIYICNPWVWMSKLIACMITIQQQACYCDMLTLNSCIFCYISKPILKWHIIMLTLQNYVTFTICHNISFFTVYIVQHRLL